MLDHLLAIVEQIPATFWGIVIGSFFTLGGVVLSNRASEQRLLQQFHHEREQKNKDREMVLRKEIYLAAAEAISAGINAVSRFPNLDIPNDEVTKEFSSKSAAIAKIHVISTPETAAALARFTGELDKIFSMLWIKRIEIANEKSATTIIGDQISNFQKNRDRLLEQLQQCNIEGVTDKRKLDILQQNIEFEQSRINDSANNNLTLTSELYSNLLEFMRECVLETHNLRRLIIPLLSAIRNELGLPFDSLTYTRILEEEISNQKETVEQAIREFNKKDIKQIVDGIIQRIQVKL